MIKRKLYAYVFVLMAVVCAACSNEYKVEGTSSATRLDGKMLFLKLFQDGEWVPVDSAEIVHGRFKMKGNADSTRLVTLYINDEPFMPFVLEDGKVSITISDAQLTAQGTPLNDLLYEFITKRNAMELQFEELERQRAKMVLDGINVDDAHAKVEQQVQELEQEMNDYVKQFIIDNADNVLGPGVFLMMCTTLPYPIMTPEIEEIMKVVPLSFKNTPLVREYLSSAKENMRLIEEQQRLQENAQAASRK